MIRCFDDYLRESGEVGYVTKTIQSITQAEGLPSVKLGELVIFETAQMGQVTALKPNEIEILVLSHNIVSVGTRVARCSSKMQILVGSHMFGKTVDALGRIVGDGDPGFKSGSEMAMRDVDIVPSGIVNRKKIERQMVTGVIAVDMMIPIGKGQRELVMGDRKTGKSYLLWKIVLSQAKQGVVCIYTAIGKKKTEIMRAEEYFKKQGVIDNTIIVAAASQDSPGEIFLAPYTAMAIAEYFRDLGKDVLVVYDDMSAHAKFYRELSLLSKKFPGRDSYPGDIFHVHSKLLERGGNYVVRLPDNREVEAAITCIPVVETIQGDITGYIQTNLMSMTDGHIYFDSDLFFKGRRPAINPFISVTRVGHQTQSKLAKDAGRVLFELMSNYERTQSFLRFGAELGENSRQIISMGDKVLAYFDQPPYSVVPVAVQIVMMAMLISGLWDGKHLEGVLQAYESDSKVKKIFDDLVSKTERMSGLIEQVRSQAQGILQFAV